MTDDEKSVADGIGRAFAGVTLGAGVGLRQGQGLDDYADGATLVELRSLDEANDWSRIDFEQLNAYSAALSFMDSEGMRFHLPAYVIADLQGVLFTTDILFYLTATPDPTYFRLLSVEQRDSIKRFLKLRLADPEFSFHHPLIKLALEQCWDREWAG